jgi:hypothetical protein
MMQNYHSAHHAEIIEIWFEAYFHPLRNTAAASGEVIVIQSNLSSVNPKLILLMKQFSNSKFCRAGVTRTTVRIKPMMD